MAGVLVAMATSQELSAAEVPDWIRGHGDELELRLTGEVTRSDGGNTEGAQLEIQINNNSRCLVSFDQTLVSGKFEKWLPVNRCPWSTITVSATCRDGARCARTIDRDELRELATNGLNLRAQLPNRSVTVHVEHGGIEVANATVRAVLSNGTKLKAKANESGLARFNLLSEEKLSHFTAWSQNQLIGGFQLSRKPIRDPRSNSYVISMYPCRPFEVHLKETNGKPIPDVEVDFFVATPEPDFNYIGWPDGFDLVTNGNGIVAVTWFPDMQDSYCYVQISDDRWVIESSQQIGDNISVFARQAADRKKVSGRVIGGSNFAGGFNVMLGSFQAERTDHNETLLNFSDADGSFSADVLPDATYAVILGDTKWVADAIDLIPYESKTRKGKHPELMLSQGIPVRVTLTQGIDRKPISGALVSINSPHNFTWDHADGQLERGSLGRSARAFSDHAGVAEILAPEGELRANVYLPGWQETQTFVVRRSESNEIHFHQKASLRSELIGKVVPWNGDPQQIAGAFVQMQAIDGETGDEIRCKTDQEGNFRIETNASQLGVMAYSSDKQFVGARVINDLTNPLHIQLFPTKSYSGVITDQAGNPVANHLVYASISVEAEKASGSYFPMAFSLPRIRIQTDLAGSYRFDGLPCQTKVRLSMNTLENELNSFEYIDEVFFLPDDEPRSKVTKIGKSVRRNEALALSERFASILRDAQLGSYHLIVIVYDQSEESNRDFVNKHVLDFSAHKTVSGYMQLQVGTRELSADYNKAFVDRLQLPTATQGVFACAYDIEGVELGRIQVDPAASDAAASIFQFIERHGPSQKDAETKWNEAFQQAKEKGQHVWVSVGHRYCAPCFKLNRWIDDHREILVKDFVLLKIDNGRDLNGQAVADRFMNGRSVGSPFHAILDANENLIVDSYGPLGNIGAISGFEGKRHFKKMLDAACSKITPQEIQMLLDTLED